MRYLAFGNPVVETRYLASEKPQIITRYQPIHELDARYRVSTNATRRLYKCDLASLQINKCALKTKNLP